MRRASGRAGRLRLTHQLAAARRGRDLLERKRRILAGELSRLRLLTETTRQEWAEAAQQAGLWAGRSLALDGAQRMRDATPDRPARVQVTWQAAMGVSYPHSAQVQDPIQGPVPTQGSTSLERAAIHHRSAVRAAAEHAAAQRAHALVLAELEATRLRRRALDRRWIPRLEDQLRRLENELDELERQENVRLRWAIGDGANGKDAQ